MRRLIFLETRANKRLSPYKSIFYRNKREPFDIKNTNRHYADPLNPQKKLDKYLSFTNGDFRVAAVPESISLLHSYLCM